MHTGTGHDRKVQTEKARTKEEQWFNVDPKAHLDLLDCTASLCSEERLCCLNFEGRQIRCEALWLTLFYK